MVAQDDTLSLSAVEMPSALPTAYEEPLSLSNFVWPYLPTVPMNFSGLVDNQGLSFDRFWENCSVMCAELPLAYSEKMKINSFWRYSGGSQIRWGIYWPLIISAGCQSVLDQWVCPEIGSKKVFSLRENIQETVWNWQHHFLLLTFVLSVFHILRPHHTTILNTLKLQRNNSWNISVSRVGLFCKIK